MSTWSVLAISVNTHSVSDEKMRRRKKNTAYSLDGSDVQGSNNSSPSGLSIHCLNSQQQTEVPCSFPPNDITCCIKTFEKGILSELLKGYKTTGVWEQHTSKTW